MDLKIWNLVLLWCLVLGVWCLFCRTVSAASAFIYETPTEFLTTGDFNGDGVPDVLVLDRFTGNARIGYQTNSVLTWAGPLTTGVASPDSMTVGRLRETNRDAIAITSMALNRIHLVSVANPSNNPPALTPRGIGPNLLIALSSPYGTNGNRDWLVAGSADNNPNLGTSLLELYALVGDALSVYQDSVAQQAYLGRGNSLRLGASPATYAAAIQRGSSNDQFIAFSASNHFAMVLTRTNLPSGSDYVFGTFNGEALPRFFFYVPGQSNVLIQSVIQANGSFLFDVGTAVSFPEPVQRVYYVSQGSDGIALIQFGDGVQGLTLPGGTPTLAATYRSGAGAAGNVFTGVVPLINGNFVLLDAPAGSATAAHDQVVHFDGANYTQLSAANLPATTTRTTRANLWLFQTEPFVSLDPGFVGSTNAPDWSSSATISGNLTVRTETDGGASQGLGSPVTNNLGAQPTGAAFAMPDQYRDSISLFTYSAPRRPDTLSIAISPTPGLYGAPIQVSFTVLGFVTQVFYRLGSLDSWRVYATPFTVTNDTTIQYYATNSVSALRSRLYAATYTFGNAGRGTPQPPLDLAPGSTNPAPVFRTNVVVLADVGTVFYGRRSPGATPGFLGPSPYLSFADSPFSNTNAFNYFYLETFEDGVFNTPGATPSGGWSVVGPGSTIDSVDGDDGVIDGSGAGGHSYYSGGSQTSLTISFSAAALGGHFPTHAGIVWTDVGFVSSGSFGFGNVVFSAHDASGVSLGSITGVNLGDGSSASQTAEDRFFGIVNPSGISSITITMPASTDWEVDHVQYGYASQAIYDGSIWAINLDGSGDTFITTGARPRVSPDGRYLAFLREGMPFSNQGNLWVRDLSTAQETRLLGNSTSIVCYDWDYTGTNLVFDYNCGFSRIGLSGPPVQLGIPIVCNQGAPSVNPIDGRIAFANLNPNAPGIYTAPPDGSSRQNLNLNLTGARWPVWSPDGQDLVLANGDASISVDAGHDLYIAELTPTNLALYQITSIYDGVNRFPHGARWSPDQDALVGAGTLFRTNGIWVIPLDGDCLCSMDPPYRLPTSPGDPIDFVGSILTAPELAPREVRPGFFIALEPDAVVVYWGTLFADFNLEFATDLTPTATWQPIPGPYETDGFFFYYRESLSDLSQKKFFRLHKP